MRRLDGLVIGVASDGHGLLGRGPHLVLFGAGHVMPFYAELWAPPPGDGGIAGRLLGLKEVHRDTGGDRPDAASGLGSARGDRGS